MENLYFSERYVSKLFWSPKIFEVGQLHTPKIDPWKWVKFWKITCSWKTMWIWSCEVDQLHQKIMSRLFGHLCTRKYIYYPFGTLIGFKISKIAKKLPKKPIFARNHGFLPKNHEKNCQKCGILVFTIFMELIIVFPSDLCMFL